MTDPRPDLKYDSPEWTLLLQALDKHCPSHAREFVGIMHGFRCAGLRLHRGAKGYVLRPDFDPSSKWRTKEEYETDRNQWLMPWSDNIVGILQALTKEMVTVDAS